MIYAETACTDGDEDGIKPLNEAADTKFLIWGTTIQADSGKPVDVRGLAKSWLAMKDANAVPVIDVMPVGGWKGFTDDDDTQAWTIAMASGQRFCFGTSHG